MPEAFQIIQSDRFAGWLTDLRDDLAAAAIARRLRRFALGLFGDTKPLGGGLMEARVDVGPGYRVYYVRRGECLIILLCGGDKGSQSRDIAAARALSEELAG